MFHLFGLSFGANKYLIDDYTRLKYTKVSNGIGTAVLTVDASHAAVDGLALDDELEIWRGNIHPLWDYTPFVDFRGLYRGPVRRRLYDGSEVVDLTFQHEMALLQRPIHAYQAGQDGVSSFAAMPIDEIMHALVVTNFNGVTADRLYAASSIGVVSDTITSFATAIDYSAAYRNLLTALQELADYEDIVFNLTKDSSSTADWTFTVQETTIGADRRDEVYFEVGRENLVEANVDQVQLASTLAIAAGQGDGTDREVVTYAANDFDAAINQIELFLDSRHLDSTDKLTAYAQAILEQGRYRPQLRFQVHQRPDLAYGKHYGWGDIVTVRYGGVTFVQRIREVAVSIDGNDEEIQLGTEDIA